MMVVSSSSAPQSINTSYARSTGVAEPVKRHGDSFSSSMQISVNGYNMFGKTNLMSSVQQILQSVQNKLLAGAEAQNTLSQEIQDSVEEAKDGSKITLIDLSHAQINAGDGSDTILGDNISNVQLNAGGGNDSIDASGVRNSQINAGEGKDNISMSGVSHSQINAGDEDDRVELTGARGTQLNAGGGNDYVRLRNASEMQVNGGDGDDTIDISGIADSQINAGDGADHITIDGITGSQINLGSGDDVVVMTNASGVQVNAGTGNKDIIISGSGRTHVNLGGGSSRVVVNNSIETGVNASGGNDTVIFRNDTDEVGSVSFKSGAGNDHIEVEGNYSAYVSGGTGDDYISLNLMMTGRTSSIGYSKGDGHDFIDVKSGKVTLSMNDIRKDEVDVTSSFDEETGLTSTLIALKDGSGSITLSTGNDSSVKVIFGGIRS